MGKRFLLFFFTVSAVFSVLHAENHGSPTDSDSNSLNHLEHLNLLQRPDPKSSVAEPPEEDDEERVAAEAPMEWENRKIGKHHSSDNSKAGGAVIIAALVTVTFAAVYCYIRVTRKKHTEILK